MIEILNKLSCQEYVGDKYNQQQYNFIRDITKDGRIFITGDLFNDYMLETKYKLWSIGQKDIQVPSHDRAIILYYKNEYPNLYTIKSEEFYVYYQILSLMIDKKLLKSFNTIKVICRHSVPSCYDSITCEKVSQEIGPKNFEVFCNVYANTIFFSSATVNSDRFGSKSIITRNIHDIKKNIPDTHILFDYIFCPVDQTGQYTDGDEFIWQDGTRSTYRIRYGKELQHQSAIDLNKKVEDLIACVLKLDSNPLFVCS